MKDRVTSLRLRSGQGCVLRVPFARVYLCTCLPVYMSWFQTTIIVSRDDVLDHDLVFPDHNVIN